jgi:diaminopropionate ammonia-lyase
MAGTMIRMMSWYSSPAARDWTGPSAPCDAYTFHRSLPGYAPTPLVPVPAIAAGLGVGRVLVKDESSRLGLPAFKVLGASWACRQVLELRPGATLVTATDGNHGRAVARMAAHFGTEATVFVPAVMLPEPAARITEEGAQVVWVDGDYDAAVRRAAEFAGAQPGRALVQDTAWDGYEEVPAWIVEGYQTLLEEVDAQLDGTPDLVAVPVGVGSLAEAVVRHYRRPGAAHPRVLAVEPDTAACVLASLTAGRPVTVPTAATVMAGLNCGTVSGSAWPVLRAGCDAAVAVSDDEALRAVDDLGRLGVSSGPSGAAALAGVRAALTDPERRAVLDLDDDAVVVLLNTEGRTR